MPLTEKERETLLSRVQPVSDIERKYKMVLYGNPGVGKTVLSAALAAITGNALMLTSEPGYTVLTKPEHSHLLDTTQRVPFTSLKGIDGYTELIADGSIDAETYILDNMSGIQDKVLATNHDRLKTKLKREDPDLSTLQDYQIVAHQMRKPIVNLLDLDKNVIIICHARIPSPEQIGKGETTRPDLTKYVFNLVNEKADVVAYMNKDRNGARYVQTVSENNLTAKSRITPEGKFSPEEFFEQMTKWQPNL